VVFNSCMIDVDASSGRAIAVERVVRIFEA